MSLKLGNLQAALFSLLKELWFYGLYIYNWTRFHHQNRFRRV